jgi:hypothetical protein
MSFNMNNLRRLGDQLSISIQPDEDGYLGRECPVEACMGYFKITLGTGVQGPAPCHCPYCGHSGESKTFFTQAQIEYINSVVSRGVADAIHKDLKSMEGVSLKVKRGTPLPIKYYREQKVETEVICENCTLRYAIFGVFGWCPDCGAHNSFQILTKNFELV